MGVYVTIGNVFFETLLTVAAVVAFALLAREYFARRTSVLLFYCASYASVAVSMSALFGGQILHFNGHGSVAVDMLKACLAFASVSGLFFVFAFSNAFSLLRKHAVRVAGLLFLVIAVARLTALPVGIVQGYGISYPDIAPTDFLIVCAPLPLCFVVLFTSRTARILKMRSSHESPSALDRLQFVTGLLGVAFLILLILSTLLRSASPLIPAFAVHLAFLFLACVGAAAEGEKDPAVQKNPLIIFRRSLVMKAVLLNAGAIWLLTIVMLAVISSAYVESSKQSRLVTLQRDLQYFSGSHQERDLLLLGEAQKFAEKREVQDAVTKGDFATDAAFIAATEDALKVIPGARVLRVVDGEGVILYSSISASEVGLSLNSSRAVLRALKGGKTVDVEHGDLLGVWTVRSAVPVDANTTSSAVVVIDTDVDTAFNFSEYISVAGFGASSYGYVAEKGDLVFSSGEAPSNALLTDMKLQVLPSGIAPLDSVTDHAFMERGLTTEGAPDGFFFVTLSNAALDAETFRIIALVAIVTVFAILLIAALLLIGIGSVLRPVRELRLAAAKVENDQYDHRVSYESPDELGTLASAFNHLFETIQSRTEALKSAVQERQDFLEHATREFRTPLNVFRWTLEMMRFGDTGRFNKEQMELIEQLHQTNERMTKMVQNLQDVTLIDRERVVLKKRALLAEDLVDEVAGLVAVECRSKNIALDWKRPATQLPAVSADPAYVNKVLLNLVSNAVKYTPQHGHVELAVERVDRSAEDGRPGDFVKVTIEDNGIGIPLDDSKRVFSRFFRAKNITGFEIEGTGIGLYLAKRLVELHGGDIRLESREGVGTTVSFTLPVAPPEASPKKPSKDLT